MVLVRHFRTTNWAPCRPKAELDDAMEEKPPTLVRRDDSWFPFPLGKSLLFPAGAHGKQSQFRTPFWSLCPHSMVHTSATLPWRHLPDNQCGIRFLATSR